MAKDRDKEAGTRGSREAWLDAALQVLVDSGVDAVRIALLADRTGLSRTGFYWFFKDRAALLAAALEHWDRRNTDALVAAAEAYAETPAEAVLNVISVFLDETLFDPRLDFAVRGWALQSADVMSRVRAADERRLAVLRAMFERHGHGPDDADVRAKTMYLVQIGYIAMQVSEPLDVRMERVPRYVEVYAGVEPSARDMARFRARHSRALKEFSRNLNGA